MHFNFVVVVVALIQRYWLALGVKHLVTYFVVVVVSLLLFVFVFVSFLSLLKSWSKSKKWLSVCLPY